MGSLRLRNVVMWEQHTAKMKGVASSLRGQALKCCPSDRIPQGQYMGINTKVITSDRGSRAKINFENHAVSYILFLSPSLTWLFCLCSFPLPLFVPASYTGWFWSTFSSALLFVYIQAVNMKSWLKVWLLRLGCPGSNPSFVTCLSGVNFQSPSLF